MPPSPCILQADYANDPLALLADRIVEDAGGKLPVLDRVLVLVPDLDAGPRLRRLLLERVAMHGHAALLGPRITRLSDWLAGFAIPERRILDEPERELMLVEALRNHRTLFGKASLWALAESLLELFDDMTRRRVGVPEDLQAFTDRLVQAYGSDDAFPSGLGMEARLVHTLWHAWHEQLAAGAYIDRAAADLMRLGASQASAGTGAVYLAGFPILEAPEVEWLSGLAACRPVTVVVHGRGDAPALQHPDAIPSALLQNLGEKPDRALRCNSAYTRFLDTVFAGYSDVARDLVERARAFLATEAESPANGRLTIFQADNTEQEARSVELQIRRWLLEGKQSLAVVTENRRLARRVRALLERAGIQVQDRGGWALSTTSAAALVERWLECLEEDFPYLALLDLLKSPFLVAEHRRERHLATVYRLERDVILHENVGRGLAAYRRRLDYRRHRLPDAAGAALQPVAELLEHLRRAAEPLRRFIGTESPPAEVLDALLHSLEKLGATRALEEDAAGARVLQTLASLQRAAGEQDTMLHWTELRTWMGASLEHTHFRPPVTGSPVVLTDLAQSVLGHYEALVLAGAERDHLPGSGGQSPFFNDGVRRDLGLPEGDTRRSERFYHFRRLLEAAPRILVTCRREQDGEPVAPSPWVESLQAFHRLAYDEGLGDDELALLVRTPEAEVVNRSAPLPCTETAPRPRAEATLLPHTLSASGYQQLMDCPYQFFAARLLHLAPPDAIREALEKSDYGERVHRCLEAFHKGGEGLPGPFDQPVTRANRDRAIHTMETIAEAVFADDLEDNFLHRGWLERWRVVIPAYIDWQLRRDQQWRVQSAEVSARREAPDGLTLQGRLDRLDAAEGRIAVTDYKTGRVPSDADVLTGEAVQLPCYALLAEAETGMAVEQVQYLELGKEKVKSRAILEGDRLHELKNAVDVRLSELFERLKSGAEMPAWGDATICGYCPMDGLCRRQAWHSDEEQERQDPLPH
ncbi:PD-(D/E)XK nuclease family protein [Thiohalomonas denitrificans]|uniref:PD-(D/E)XK nuclease family protein n=1 Tax=Thiohalomonas denitrificans TaxID=415747 RepID=UPI0026ED6DEC|nr:PD-(D/E)XK nuclease family protein [Thiohalomonas denitrificans]